jgi:hypothetical protein
MHVVKLGISIYYQDNKELVNILKSTNKNNTRVNTFIIFLIMLILTVWIFRAYTIRTIDYKYTGVKYQTGNFNYEEPVNIEIKGKYIIHLFSEIDEFHGEIVIGDNVFDYSYFTQKVFNYKKIPLTLKTGSKAIYGDVFYSSVFEQITIPIREQKWNEQFSWNSSNGWLISAPCKDRKQAVELSNKLIPKQYRSNHILE